MMHHGTGSNQTLRWRRWLTLGAALLVAGGIQAADLPFRIWTAHNGNRAEARAVGREGSDVMLEMKDGRPHRMPLALLSSEDRAYVDEAFPLAEPESPASPVGPAAPADPVAVVRTVEGIAAEPGRVSARIECRRDPSFGYFLWLPPDFDAARQWPVMYLLDPGGGKAQTVNRYIKGATFNGFILVVSAESRNGYDGSRQAIKAMVADVNARLPINPARQYASGFSGGARMAGWLGSEMRSVPMAGVLCCGAGPGYSGVYRLAPRTALYGLCGTRCFNRWDMPVFFNQQPSRAKRLRYFVGRHDWANEDLIRDAMIWLNASTLGAEAGRNPALRADAEALIDRLLVEAQTLAETAPLRAYELAELSERFTILSPGLNELRALQRSLKSTPVVAGELAALADEDRLIARHFNARFNFRDGADPRASRAALRLAETHAETSREPILRDLAERCVNP